MHDFQRHAITTSALMLAAALAGAPLAASAQTAPPPPANPAAKAPAKQAAAAQPAATAKKAAPAAPGEKPAGEKGGQAIIALVNDEPVSAYDVEQRISLLLLRSRQIDEYVRANAQERWQRIVKDPKINEEFQAFMQKRNPQSREQAMVLQREFATVRQKAMVDDLRREARARVRGGIVKDAREEIIDERLKLQAAKGMGIAVADADVSAAITEIAKKNEKTEKEFAAMLAGMGVNIDTMRDQLRANLAWRDVVRRKFGAQISIGTRDIEKAVAAAGSGSGTQTELQLQRVLLSWPAKSDEKVKATRFAEAEALRKKFSGCKSTPALASGVQNARFEDLGTKQASTIADPTRSVLLATKAGEMTPPSYAPGGVELYAVCARNEKALADAKRDEVHRELQAQEFEMMARKYLKDLRQDAVIEYR
jgi:peptidyl-prolyl cis-trans isomerase SurA